MQSSLERLRALPADTRVYCAHEYTADNLRFARAVEPANEALTRYSETVAAARARDEATIPTRLDVECRINPFLRWDAPDVVAAARRRGLDDKEAANAAAVFARVRAWKDQF